MKLQWSPPETGGASKAVPEETVIRITLQWSPPETGGASRHRRPHAADDRTAAVESAGDRRSEGAFVQEQGRGGVAAVESAGDRRSEVEDLLDLRVVARVAAVESAGDRRSEGSTFQPVLIRGIGPSRERCAKNPFAEASAPRFATVTPALTCVRALPGISGGIAALAGWSVARRLGTEQAETEVAEMAEHEGAVDRVREVEAQERRVAGNAALGRGSWR